MSLGAAAMSMAGSDPRAEQLSTAAQKHYEAGEYAKAAEAYRGAMQLAPGCDPHPRRVPLPLPPPSVKKTDTS